MIVNNIGLNINTTHIGLIILIKKKHTARKGAQGSEKKIYKVDFFDKTISSELTNYVIRQISK